MATPKRRIAYFGNGPANTGGYFHELFWYQSLIDFFESQKFHVKSLFHRPESYHSGFGKLFTWLGSLLFIAPRDFVLCPARCALPIVINSWFTRSQVWVFLHSFDAKSVAKNRFLSWYYALLFVLIKRSSKAQIVVVDSYWESFLCDQLGFKKSSIITLPNLFDTSYYASFRSDPNRFPSIHLGMWSSKLDKRVYDMAARLSHAGYFCFFTSDQDLVSFGSYGYEIVYCPTHEDYAAKVANSQFTLAFSQIPEGWSRVAHESVLLGTPVIGSDNAGLGNLLREAHCFIVDSVEDVVELVKLKPGWKAPEAFIKKYDKQNRFAFLQTALSK